MCFSFLLYSIYYELKTSQLFYDGFICFICCIGCTYFAYLSTQRHLDLSYLHKADYSIVSEMNRGRIPIPVILYSILPLIATSTGMTIRTAKFAVLYNIFTFLIIAYNISNITGICIDKSCHSIDKQQRDINFHLDLILSSILMSLSWFCCLPAAEIGDNFIRTKEIDAKADAMLSNILKNSIAGASCLIEIEQEEMKANPCEKCGIRHRLTQARHQLLHSMRWCMSRQVMVELASGTYKTYLSDFNLNNFFIDMNVMSENNKIIFEDITGISDRYLLKLDENMVHVAIENGLFSASSHGTGNIKLETFIIDNDKKNSQKCLQFKISNSIPESVLENITSEKGKEFNKKLQKHAERARQHGSRPTNTLTLATVNSSAGLHRISVAVTGAGGSFDIRYDEITSQVILTIKFPVILSHNQQQLHHHQDLPNFHSTLHVLPSFGNTINHQSTKNMLESNDKLSLQNNELRHLPTETSTLPSTLASIPVLTPMSTSTSTLRSSTPFSIKTSQKNFAKKESLQHNLKRKGNPISDDAGIKLSTMTSTPIIIDSTRQDLQTVVQKNQSDNKQSEQMNIHSHKRIKDYDECFNFPSNLKVCAIDDSKLICKGYERLLLPLLKCDSKSSLVTCPKSNDDVDEFMTYIKTKVNPINIVIFDQNIDLNLVNDGATTILGTDLAKELKDNHFKGLVVIRSANSSSSDFDQYMSTGVVDFCVGKSESHKDLASRIQNAYISKNMISH
mmetsp:Transcript_729/g.906  ORF Transcript_729/g.906 Transcript_729/m.906 type:complete len:735 (+) Transcript_729:145-2349(+)